MTINVRVRDGMCPDPTTGDGGATEGDIRGSFSDIIDVIGVKDLVAGHCLVTQNSPAAMSVLVAPGVVYISNADYDELDSNQVKFWEAIVTVSTAVTITANTSGSARVDLVCAKMDTAVPPDEHASNIATLVAVAGTPGAGTPATPDNHYVLATVAVANGAATIITANITDSRVQSKINDDYLNSKLADYIRGDGWINPNETWQFVSVDDPTGIFRVNADVTGKYSAGMRIKFTNGGNVIYGIITVVGAYSGGYTSITFLHEIDPTDSLAKYLMANSAITLNYYSTQKAPVGFPLEPTKWTVVYANTGDTSTGSVASAATITNWANHLLAVPIGCWKLSFNCGAALNVSATTNISMIIGLSTTNNSFSDAILKCISTSFNISTSDLGGYFSGDKEILLTAKTPYYLNVNSNKANSTMYCVGSQFTTIIKAICAYL